MIERGYIMKNKQLREVEQELNNVRQLFMLGAMAIGVVLVILRYADR